MSKGLEALERIKNNTFPYTSALYDIDDLNDDRTIIAKELHALEVIINKNVSIWGFRYRVFGYYNNNKKAINDTYEYYLNVFGPYHNGFNIKLLTEEEFNLLKEVLK